MQSCRVGTLQEVNFVGCRGNGKLRVSLILNILLTFLFNTNTIK